MKIFSKTALVLFYIIVLFVIDILNKDQVHASEAVLNIVKVIKSLFYLSFITIMIKDKDYKFINMIWVLILLFVLGQVSILFKNSGLVASNITGALRELLLYCFPFVFVCFLRGIREEKSLQRLSLIYEGLTFVVVITTFLGFVFSIPFFETYNQRFGYLGLLPKSITATYFFVTSLLYTNYFFNKSIYVKALFFMTFGASLLVGTKGIYFFLPLLFFFNLINNKWYLDKRFYLCFMFFIGLVFLTKESILRLFKEKFSLLFKLYYKDGFITAITSFRDKIFFTTKGMYESIWEWYNLIIGGRVITFPIFEMSILDLIISFGILGTVVYLKNMYLIFFDDCVIKSRFFIFSTLSVLLVSIFAGQFFENISSISYVIVAFYIMQQDIKYKMINES